MIVGGMSLVLFSAGCRHCVVRHVPFCVTPPPPVTLACSASPALVFPGDTVTVTATAGDLDPKLSAIYTWSGSSVTGNGTTAIVATGSLAPGSYTVKGEIKEGNPARKA